MLMLILIDVQYSQKAVFSFEKSSNRQNYISSDFIYLWKQSSSSNFQCPPPPPPNTPYCYLENTEDGVQYLFKTLNFGNNS